MTRPLSEKPAFPGERPAPTPKRAAQLRKRVLRGCVLFALLGLLLAVVVVWQRDTLHRQRSVEALQPFQRALQAKLDEYHRIPLALPRTDPDGTPLPEHEFTYLSIEAAQALRTYDEPIIMGEAPPVGMGLRREGRAVIILENGRCEARWIDRDALITQRRKQNAWVRQR
ncbi:MAG: hypothetical protein GY842_06875 [bacterium]|nr:hypothetical protein [bacterium]